MGEQLGVSHHFCLLLQISEPTSGPTPHCDEGAFSLPEVLLVLSGQPPVQEDPQQGLGPLLLDVLISPSPLCRRGVRFWQCLRFISNSLVGLPHKYPRLKSTNNLFNTFLLSLYLSISLLTFTRSCHAFMHHENVTQLTNGLLTALVRPAAAKALILNREAALSGTAENHTARPRAAAASALLPRTPHSNTQL